MLGNIFFCDMAAKKEIIEKQNDVVFLFDKNICNYIRDEWFPAKESHLSLSNKFGVHRDIIRKIRTEDGYRLPMSSLAIIVFNKSMQLSDFFRLIEKKYGNLKDVFVEKSVLKTVKSSKTTSVVEPKE